MSETTKDYDLLIIGSGPAGQKAAISAAKCGARVGLVEREPLAGGVCLNTGTIPSKSLREAVMYLSGYRQRGYYGSTYRMKENIKRSDLMARTSHVVRLERDVINEDLDNNGVRRLVGTARVTGPHGVAVECGGSETHCTAENILIAVGTRPRRPADVPFDSWNVFDSDGLYLNGSELVPLPDSVIVLGAGVIGIEYACMFATLDIPTTLVDPRPNPLGFVDEEIAPVLYDSMESQGVHLIFGTVHSSIEILGEPDQPDARVRATLADGTVLEADALLFTLGREPATAGLGLAEVGVELDKRGYIKVDKNFRSSVPSIYAAGDVVGFPSLASTSSEQGRVAAMHALGQAQPWEVDLLPYGIYTIPEISMVGKTEAQLRETGIGYFKGTALWRDTARGKILGDLSGALKLLFRSSDRKLVGIHIIGEGATELVHIGQAVMAFGGGPAYFLQSVFNYPTLAEAYKRAAHNAINRLSGTAHSTAPLREQVMHGNLVENFLRLSGEVRLPRNFS
jgi:NAD(P) transhydrogenase